MVTYFDDCYLAEIELIWLDHCTVTYWLNIPCDLQEVGVSWTLAEAFCNLPLSLPCPRILPGSFIIVLKSTEALWASAIMERV